MANNAEKLERLSARLDKDSQEKVDFLIKLGYGPTDLVRDGIDLLYQQEVNSKGPSIPSILQSLASSTTVVDAEGPDDLAANHKKYFKDLLIEKYSG